MGAGAFSPRQPCRRVGRATGGPSRSLIASALAIRDEPPPSATRNSTRESNEPRQTRDGPEPDEVRLAPDPGPDPEQCAPAGVCNTEAVRSSPEFKGDAP